MSALFLMGGGGRESDYVRTYWRFIQAATVAGRRRIAIVLTQQPAADMERRQSFYRSVIDLFPVTSEQYQLVSVSRDDPLTVNRLEALDPTGVIIGDGDRVCSRQVLCSDTRWLSYLLAHKLPCAGDAAGAALFAETAVMGGGQIALPHDNANVAPRESAGGLDCLEVNSGLGLVPFAVEVQATQRGTLGRLVHAVGEGLVPSGWAIDEGCMLQLVGGTLRVFGSNNAYRVRRMGNRLTQVRVVRAGTVLARQDW
jgi:cyanophycinase